MNTRRFTRSQVFIRSILKSMILLFIGFMFEACSEKDSVLSPARNLSGTWSTPSAVTFYMASDGCGNYVRYNSTPVTMTWEITEIDENTVDVWLYANSIGNTTVIGSNCGSPSVLNFPLNFRGVISSSNLRLQENQMQYSNSGAALGMEYVDVGNFNFTTDNLTGTIDETDCPIYCMGYETDPQKCILTRK